MDSAIARIDRRLDEFAAKQDQNVGKAIEGTGLLQVPYFVWLGGVALFLFVAGMVLYAFLKVAALSNPAVAVGTRVASLGASRLARGFGQMVSGGESYKEEIKGLFDEGTARVILNAFQKHHRNSQDADVQAAIRELTE